MKILSIAIPVYNTEKYIKRCMDSILLKEIIDDIEIILVNDGSKDNSINIMNEYKDSYPQSVVVIDKENGGHGSTINAALTVASGKYFRVLDSDDWFDSIDFITFVKNLKNEDVDLIITNYRKEYIYDGTSEEINWKGLEENKVYKFNEIDLKILNKEYFVMANSTYKTELLRDSNLKLLEKTFYVDMQYNVIPISKLNTFKYMNLDIYRYFIGRPDQSMNLQNFVKNRSNHDRVMKFLIDYYINNKESFSENQIKYIKQILYYMLTTHYYIYCVYAKNNRKSIYKEIKDFDKYLKSKDIELYKMMDEIGQIKCNRKTKFIFTRINSQFFTRIVSLFGKIIKH